MLPVRYDTVQALIEAEHSRHVLNHLPQRTLFGDVGACFRTGLEVVVFNGYLKWNNHRWVAIPGVPVDYALDGIGVCAYAHESVLVYNKHGQGEVVVSLATHFAVSADTIRNRLAGGAHSIFGGRGIIGHSNR